MKRLSIAALTIILTLPICAQRFKGGVLGGINVSTIEGDDYGGYFKAGAVGGAFVNTMFDNKMGGQLEIKYSAKGAGHPTHWTKVKLTYIDFPVLITYKLGDDIKGIGGVSFNYLFSAQQYDAGWVDFEEKVNPIESAIVVGAQYHFLHRLSFDARFSYSLFPVRTNIIGSAFGENAWYNNVLSFSLHYQIGQ